MLRSRLSATFAGVFALCTALVLAPSASAGDGPTPAVLLYSSLDGSGGYPALATVPGSNTTVTISGKTTVNLLPSASADGSVVTYLVTRTVSGLPVYAFVVRKNGRMVHRVRMGLDVGVFPRTSSDGSAVVFGGPGGLRALDVATGADELVCPKCPALSSISSGTLSPDNSKIAIEHRTSGENVIEVFRIRDGHSIATAPVAIGAGNSYVAWKPDGSALAFVSKPTGAAPSNLGGIYTLTMGGTVARTSFHQPTSAKKQIAFLSPFWRDDSVWAIRFTVDAGVSMSGQVVSASDWQHPFHTVGAVMWKGTNEQQFPVWALSSWTNAMPTAVKGK